MAYNDDNLDNTGDNFKRKFKYYKSKMPKPSGFDDVITYHSHMITKINRSHVMQDSRTDILGLQKLTEWQLFSFKDHYGLYLIRNPFTAAGQRYWIQRCLEEYPKHPNKVNIVERVDDWWAECHKAGVCNTHLLKKLRWTTLGYHHNWDTKLYSESNRGPFPEELAELCDVVAQYFGCNGFWAQAAIVNYYHMDSTLSPHIDHSEANLEAPLFSFSFGQSAIFLIGGKLKSVTPSAILLNSGDIVIMSKESRLSYHAVPLILPSPFTPWLDDEQSIDIATTQDGDHSSNNTPFKYLSDKDLSSFKRKTDWSNFKSYIEESRINVNVRQVLNQNQIVLEYK